MVGTSDTDIISNIKDGIIKRALVKSLQADPPEAFDPSIPTNVHINSNRAGVRVRSLFKNSTSEGSVMSTWSSSKSMFPP